MSSGACVVIANPAARGGRTVEVLQRMRGRWAAVLGAGTRLSCTGRAGEGRALAERAVLEGARHLVVVGGDGTVHEVVNGVCALPEPLADEVTLSILTTGTGCGFARSLGIPRDLESQLRIACGTTVRAVDIGHLELAPPHSGTWFVNECQVGFGAEVVRRTSPSRKARGGSSAYALTSLFLAFRSPVHDLAVASDDGVPREMVVTGVAIGNGAVTAGGMRLTPEAVLDDGLMDVLVIRARGAIQRLLALSRVRSGSHLRLAGCDCFQARRVMISSPGEATIPVSVDGELVGCLPARFEIGTRRIRVRSPEQREEAGQ